MSPVVTLHLKDTLCLVSTGSIFDQSNIRSDSRTGSRLVEVNIWVWRYGRALPTKISVEVLENAGEMQWKGV